MSIKIEGDLIVWSILWNCNILLFSLLYLFSLYTSALGAAAQSPPSPESQITVKNYKWGPGGAGTVGIIKEITLENKSKTTYKNIKIEANFYTTNDVPLGSLRSTIHDVLPGESEKTFYNVNFGFMHSQLEKTVLRIVGAETLEALGLPADLIVVKSWQWTGGQYSTEGILKEITLENKSATNFRNIEIQLEYLRGNGQKVGPSRAVIHDILPAKSEKTFYGINVGFRQPDVNKTFITVIDASRAPFKKPKSSLAKKGVPIGKPKKKAGEEITAKTTEKQITYLSENTGTAKTPQTKVGGTRVAEGLKEETTPIESPKEEATQEEEEPIPRDDIVVKDFKWGGGITGTIGVVRELTLENKSDITYSNIELDVDFYSRSDRRRLGSNKVTIHDILPANSEKTFQDIKAGFLNFLPEEIEIKVVGATVVR